MRLTELEQNITDVTAAIAQENIDHDAKIKQLTAEQTRLRTAKDQLVMGVDVDRINNAEKLLYIRRFERLTADMIQRAIDDVLTGFKHMTTRTISIKDYSGFSGQQVDCEYGYGPSHGYIVCEIGLCSKGKVIPTDIDAIEDILYFLNMCRRDEYVKTRILPDNRR